LCHKVGRRILNLINHQTIHLTDLAVELGRLKSPFASPPNVDGVINSIFEQIFNDLKTKPDPHPASPLAGGGAKSHSDSSAKQASNKHQTSIK
jgi:hypothetical protein